MISWLFSAKRRETAALTREQRACLQRNVWQYRRLPDAQRERLERVAAEMIDRRVWEGGSRLVVTDEMRATVAGAAALLTLGYDDAPAFDRVPSIILYRSAYEADGEARLGEAWQGGPIVLSWPDVLRTARRSTCGTNLVLHEFAHHVDGLDGEMDGRPAFERDDAARWRRIASLEFDRLVARTRRREVTLLDQYGSTNLAEFFAVATECFFERPHDLRSEHDELYDLLSVFYRQDPTEWAPPAHRLARRRDTARHRQEGVTDFGGLGLDPIDEEYVRGEAAWRAGRPADAVTALDRVLAERPDDAEALALRAAARIDLEEFESAHSDALRAVEIEPANVMAHTAAAEAMIDLDDPNAEHHARTAHRLDRDNVDALLFCGMLALENGRTREAKRYLRRLVRIDRTWEEAHYWLARAYEQAGDERLARHHDERARWLAPDDDPAEEPDADR